MVNTHLIHYSVPNSPRCGSWAELHALAGEPRKPRRMPVYHSQHRVYFSPDCRQTVNWHLGVFIVPDHRGSEGVRNGFSMKRKQLNDVVLAVVFMIRKPLMRVKSLGQWEVVASAVNDSNHKRVLALPSQACRSAKCVLPCNFKSQLPSWW